MASIVIVTRQCYLLCESINFISVHEMDEADKEDSLFFSPKLKRKSKKKLTPKQQLLEKLKKAAQLYKITIDFIPTPTGSTNSSGLSKGNHGSVDITVRGYDRCIELYMDMISQIREQQPDKLFLDKMVEKFFTENPIEEVSK